MRQLRVLTMILFMLPVFNLAQACTVAVASNFSATAKKLLADFKHSHGFNLRLSSASTGKLYHQILHGAPYCVFLAADKERPQQLIAQNKATPNSLFMYAQGQLALWSKTAPPNLHTLSSAKKIAIANPKLAPYGIAAVETLKNANLYKAMQKNIVYGENINQTLQFVATKNATVGFVALAQLLRLNNANNGQYFLIPQELYSPIEQYAVLLNTTKAYPEAEAFMRYLQSEEAQKLINAEGYNTYGKTLNSRTLNNTDDNIEYKTPSHKH